VEGVGLIEFLELAESRQSGPTELGPLLDLFAQICHEVERGHRTGRIHGSLGAQSIEIDGHGRPRVLGWAAPGSGGDVRDDVRSLGVLLYEMLTGQRPEPENPEAPGVWYRRAGHRDHVGGAPYPADEALDRIVLIAIDPDPDCRWQWAGQLREQIEAYLARPARAGRWRRPARILASLAAVLIVGMGVGLGLLGSRLVDARRELTDLRTSRRIALAESARAEQRWQASEEASNEQARQTEQSRARAQDLESDLARAHEEIRLVRAQADRATALLDDLRHEQQRRAEASAHGADLAWAVARSLLIDAPRSVSRAAPEVPEPTVASAESDD